MPSCRVILKKLVRDKRITIDEYDKLLRNLKPEITKEDAIDYLHQIRWMQAHDKEIYKQGYECGKNERNTGKWITDKKSVYVGAFLERECHCSECGLRRDFIGWKFDNYCSYCGAKMEVDE